MIESTPEEWSEILLTLSRVPTDHAFGAFYHELSSPQGYPPVGPADSLFAATYQLDELLQSHGAKLAKATYTAKQQDSNWTYSAQFEYEGQPFNTSLHTDPQADR
jgi:hypothetical protein